MATYQQLEVAGMSVEDVYINAIEKGLSTSDAAVLVGSWIFEQFGKTRRTFNYAQEFADVEADCAPALAQSFHHADWIDGESVVQAEQTAGEDGFNHRFHQIESDLAALGQDLTHVFTCLAELRQQLSNLLSEIRTEVNRLNSDVYELSSKNDGNIFDKVPNYGGLVDQNAFLGATKLGDKYVTMWNTTRGIMMLPAVLTIGTDVVNDPRINNPAHLAEHIAESPRIQEAFRGQPVNKREFIERFGNEMTTVGVPLHTLVEILPQDATFENLDPMIEAVSERQAAALRTTMGSDAALAQAFGLETREESVAAASLDRFSAMPAKVRGALIQHGIDTVGKLVELDAGAIREIAQSEGIEVGAGEAAAWNTMARTLTNVR